MKDSAPSHLPVKVYSPEPLLRDFFTMIVAIWRDLMDGRELAWRLFVRDLSAQYRQTYLGYVWAFLPPLAASLTFIFLNRQGIMNFDGGGMPYAAFAMIGTLLWQVFVDSVMAPPQALVAARTMLTKINFPREAVLLGGVYMVLFNFLIRLVLLISVMAYWRILPGGSIFFFPVAMFGLVLLGTAFGLLLAPLAGLYQDVSRVLPIVTQVWMLLTPVVYPARTEGLAGWFSVWNPVAPLITTAREAISGQMLTQAPGALLVILLAGMACLAGVVGFRLAMPHVIARMGG